MIDRFMDTMYHTLITVMGVCSLVIVAVGITLLIDSFSKATNKPSDFEQSMDNLIYYRANQDQVKAVEARTRGKNE